MWGVCKFFLISLVLFTSCSLKAPVTRLVGSIAWDGQAAMESERDVEFARSSILPLLKSLEVLKAGSPNNKKYLTLLARAYGQYAFGFLEEDMLKFKNNDAHAFQNAKSRANDFYKRGLDYSMNAMKRKGWGKKVEGSLDDFSNSLKGAGKSDLPLLFWTAFCWGNWINLNKDSVNAVVDVPKVEAIIKKVIELDSNYQFGSAHSFLGVIASSRPASLGGKPDEAKMNFEHAMTTGEKYLFNKVLFAQYFAVMSQDRALFKKLLNDVISSSDDLLPEQNLANGLAKRRAKILLESAGELFEGR